MLVRDRKCGDDKLIKLDYSIESPEERKALVEKILEETPDPSPAYLEILADYLVLCMEKQEKKEKKILTDNRMATVNKRETSFEGLASQMEHGEDGIYNIITNDKNIIFQPKISISKRDLDTIPCLRQLRETINSWEAALKRVQGTKQAFTIKRALIEMRKEQYLIKQSYQRPIVPIKINYSSNFYLPLEDTSYLRGSQVVIQGISLMDPKVCSAILCNYSKLKEDSYDQFEGDVWYLLLAFEELCDKALADYPSYQRVLELKIDKEQNIEIQRILKEEFGSTYSIEYISSLWRNKIPKMIAEAALESFLTWQYKEKGYPMKTCTKCGETKPAHNQFFSKNSTSKDGWYSICKKCRNKKRGEITNDQVLH